MTAAELIATLQALPQDAKVFHLWDGEPRTEIVHVWLSNDGRIITADYGQVCYSNDARPIGAPTESDDRYWESPREDE